MNVADGILITFMLMTQRNNGLYVAFRKVE